LRHYKQKSVEVVIFRRGWVNFGEYLTGKWALPTNQCWCQKTRAIAVSCGVKIFAVHCLIFVTIHASDRLTYRQNCDSNTVHCITCRTVKIFYIWQLLL